jgi:thiamine-phosphate pyrophosphorylase
MAKPPSAPETGLYLMTPQIGDADAFLPQLEEALDGGEIACLLLDILASDDNAAKRMVKAVGGVAQPRGVALLLSGWSVIAARAGADGVHVVGSRAAVSEAIESFKPERIVGVGGLRTRHEAMFLAETGVDYVMFGEPSRDGRPPPLDQVAERLDWWAELFEIPCIGYAPDLGAVPLMADAGADFVALGRAVWEHEQGPRAAVSLASRVLGQRSGR